jgi:hypothetical protein
MYQMSDVDLFVSPPLSANTHTHTKGEIFAVFAGTRDREKNIQIIKKKEEEKFICSSKVFN